MHDEHGFSIIFQVYRINLQAKTLEDLQGEKLAEIKVDSGFVSGGDTVAAVKKKVRPLLEGKSGSGPEAGAQPGLTIEEAERITLFFSGRPMRDEKLFYADHFLLLPAWVQVFLHGGDFEEVTALADKLRGEKREEPPQ